MSTTMRRLPLVMFILFCVGLIPVVSRATGAEVQRPQRPEAAPAAMYRLNFTLRIFEGNDEQTRRFTLILEERSSGKVRALRRVPVRQNGETTYIETGIKCDAQFVEAAASGTIRIEMEMIFTDIPDTAAADSPPVYEWQSRVEATVVPGETTLLSTSDGSERDRRYQLHLLAEKLR